MENCRNEKLAVFQRPANPSHDELQNESHFCHQFKRRYGLSPTEFLAGHKWQAAGNAERSVSLALANSKTPNLIPPAEKIFRSATARQ
jgi:hypothetical protein